MLKKVKKRKNILLKTIKYLHKFYKYPIQNKRRKVLPYIFTRFHITQRRKCIDRYRRFFSYISFFFPMNIEEDLRTIPLVWSMTINLPIKAPIYITFVGMCRRENNSLRNTQIWLRHNSPFVKIGHRSSINDKTKRGEKRRKSSSHTTLRAKENA